MRGRLLAGLLVFLVFGAANGISNQEVHPSPDVLAKQSLRALIAELVVSANKPDDHDPNKSLKDLGPPIEIALSFPLKAQGLRNYRAQVIHEHGTSNWTIGVEYSGEIVSYSFEASVNEAYNQSASKQETRGPTANDAVTPPPPNPTPPVFHFFSPPTKIQPS